MSADGSGGALCGGPVWPPRMTCEECGGEWRPFYENCGCERAGARVCQNECKAWDKAPRTHSKSLRCRNCRVWIAASSEHWVERGGSAACGCCGSGLSAGGGHA